MLFFRNRKYPNRPWWGWVLPVLDRLLGRIKQLRRWLLIYSLYGKCGYCGEDMGEYPTIDHKKPKSDGGTDDSTNTLPCCIRCNNLKANLSLSQFRRQVLRYGDKFFFEDGIPKKLRWMKRVKTHNPNQYPFWRERKASIPNPVMTTREGEMLRERMRAAGLLAEED